MASQPRRKLSKLEPIDLDEMSRDPGFRGMLSFLEVSPQEKAAMLAKRALVDTSALAFPVNQEPAPAPDGPVASQPQTKDSTETYSICPDSNLLPASNLVSVSRLLSDTHLPSDSDFVEASAIAQSSLLPGSDLRPPGSRLLSGSDLRTSNGRVVRIRPVRSVQDAHTVGEHLLLQAMWKKGETESEDSRILQAGLSDLSYWTGAHKTRCRAHLRSLIDKLAIEEVQTFNAAAGREGSRIYRVFSFTAILERRRRANLTHVVRTGAVVFVDPKTGDRLVPGSNLLPDSNLLTDSNMQPAPDSKLSGRPGSNLLHNNNNRCQQDPTSSIKPSSAVISALRNYIADVDDLAASQLVTRCREVAADATDEEIIHFIGLKSGKPGIRMPMGFLLTAVPKCFAGESFRQFRQEQCRSREVIETRDRMLAEEILRSPDADDEQKEWAQHVLKKES